MTRMTSLTTQTAALLCLAALLCGCQQMKEFWKKGTDKTVAARKADLELDWTKELKPEQKADIQMAYAQAAESRGQTDHAIEMYRDAVTKDPKRADGHHRLGVLYDKKGDWKNAEKEYQQALKQSPKNAQFLCDYGYSCYLQRRWADAEINLRRALEAKSDMPRAHINLGLVLAGTERLPEALDEFRQAGCSEAEAHANLAFAASLENNWEAAQREYQTALNLDPKLKIAQDGLRALAAVQQPARRQDAGGVPSGAAPTAYHPAASRPAGDGWAMADDRSPGQNRPVSYEAAR